MKNASATIPLERVERVILLVRGQKVMLDSDLAALYQVTTKALNQAGRRNLERLQDSCDKDAANPLECPSQSHSFPPVGGLLFKQEATMKYQVGAFLTPARTGRPPAEIRIGSSLRWV